MENLLQLKDNQLISLFSNEKIDKELKSKITTEINRRNLKIQKPEVIKMDLLTKLKIIVSGVIKFNYHLRESGKLIVAGRNKEYKQYLNYFIIGLFLNIYPIIFMAKYIIQLYF